MDKFPWFSSKLVKNWALQAIAEKVHLLSKHPVPHFKAPVYAKVELWGLKCGGIFSIQTSLLDISHLLHKTGFVKTESVGTVDLSANQ